MEYIFYAIYRGIFFFYLILLFITGIKDAKSKQIKNGIPITMIIIAILYRLLEIRLKQNLFENGNGGIGFCLGGFPFFLISFLGGTEKMGGGDVKFMAANGLFLGERVLAASMIGMGLATIYLFLFIMIRKPKKGVALAPFLGIGCVCSIFLK